MSAEGRVEYQKLNQQSFWFSTRFTRKTFDHSGGSYLYPHQKSHGLPKRCNHLYLTYIVFASYMLYFLHAPLPFQIRTVCQNVAIISDSISFVQLNI